MPFSLQRTYGHHLEIKVETLIDRLWPGSAEDAPEGTHRRRRKDVRDGLEALGRLCDWTVEWVRNDMVSIPVQRDR